MLRKLRDAILAVAVAVAALGMLEGVARLLESDEDREKRVPASAPLPKPDDEFRIFAFGSSSVFGNPAPELGFISQLEFWLRRSVPDRRIEVYNLAAPGKRSSWILDTVRRSLRGEPDLVYLHPGMAEFLHRDSMIRERRVLDWLSRNFALVKAARSTASRARGGGATSGLGPPPALSPYDRDSAEFRAKLDRYRANLEAIVELVRASDTPMLLSTVSSNLADWPPVNYAFSDQLYPDGFDDTLRAIEALIDTGDIAPAKDQALRSLEGHPDDAMLLYLLGRIHAAEGDSVRARELFIRARDLDPLPWRAISQSNQWIRELATREGVDMVDVEAILAEWAPAGLTGFTLVMDHAHPTVEGSSRIARAILDAMARHRLAIAPDADYFDLDDPLSIFLAHTRRTAEGDPESDYLRKSALSCMRFPSPQFARARHYLDLWLEREHSNWSVWANLATVSFAEGKIEQGTRELRRAVALRGSAEGLPEHEEARYLRAAMQHAGVTMESLTRIDQIR